MTPVVQLRKVVPANAADVFVKLEYFNTTGSYKDRMALSMIEEAEARGDLQPGMTVVEYTGGSTGSSLAFVCALKGYRFQVVSSDAYAQEKLDTMIAFGAELHIVQSKGGKITPDLVPRMIKEAEILAGEKGTYFTNQLHNPDVIVGYRTLGKELVQQLKGDIDLFCGGGLSPLRRRSFRVVTPVHTILKALGSDSHRHYWMTSSMMKSVPSMRLRPGIQRDYSQRKKAFSLGLRAG
jgi:cysteine synthase